MPIVTQIKRNKYLCFDEGGFKAIYDMRYLHTFIKSELLLYCRSRDFSFISTMSGDG